MGSVRGLREETGTERRLRRQSNEGVKLLAVSLDQSYLATELHGCNPTHGQKHAFVFVLLSSEFSTINFYSTQFQLF